MTEQRVTPEIRSQIPPWAAPAPAGRMKRAARRALRLGLSGAVFGAVSGHIGMALMGALLTTDVWGIVSKVDPDTLALAVPASMITGAVGAALCLALVGLLGGSDKGRDIRGGAIGGWFGLMLGGSIGNLVVAEIVAACEGAQAGSIYGLVQILAGKAQTPLYLIGAQAVTSTVGAAGAWAVAGLIGVQSRQPKTGAVHQQQGNWGAVWATLIWGFLAPVWIVSQMTELVPFSWLIQFLAGAIAGGFTGWLWRTTAAPAWSLPPELSSTGPLKPGPASPPSQAFFSPAQSQRLTSRRTQQGQSGPGPAAPA